MDVAAILAAFLVVSCAAAPGKPAEPCSSAAPALAAPAADLVHLGNSGSLHVWALAARGTPIHQYVKGLPADFVLADDARAPTRLTVLEPLRFEAVTLFPAYYLQKQSEQPSPRVVMTRGLALHRVERAEAPNCRAYVGFGQARQAREQRADGTESLGELLPDLEVGPVEVPCGALGGMIERDALRLPDLADDESDEPETRRLQFTPVRDEDGLTHYDATEFRIYPIPQRSSTDVTVKATAEGAGYLANQSALLLEEKKGWKKIRLQLEQELMIEGWVDAALFEPEDGSGWPDNHGGWLGGGGYSGKPPTYCSGKLAAGTRIETAAGVAWATVSREIEGIFIAGRERHRLVNFLGPYRDAFCAPQWYSQDTQGHHACLERAEVRSENVTLVCPAPKIR